MRVKRASDITSAWTPYRKEFLTININIPQLSMKRGMRTIWIETRGEKDESLILRGLITAVADVAVLKQLAVTCL